MLPALLALIPLGLQYRLGTAPLNPPEPLPLGGYTARGGKKCELAGGEIEARALVLEQGRRRVAIVAADLLTIPESLREEVERRLPKGTDLFLAATHTHCAPDSQMLNRRMDFSLPGIARFDAKWLDWYADRIAKSALAALEKKPTAAKVLTIQTGRRALNRGRRAFALADTLAVRLLGSGSKPLITHFAAHAVLYGPAHNRPDPDFPGVIRESGLFLPGAIGDMSPASTGTTPEEQIQNFGEKFLSGYWSPSALEDVPLEILRVPLEPISVQPNAEFARLNRIPEPLSQSIIRRFAPEAGFLTLVRLGKLVLVGVPGEPTAELGRRIRSAGWALGFRFVLPVSHCNGWMGYILAPEDYDRGGYEASLAFHGRSFGDLVVQKAKEGLAALAKSKRAPRP